MEDGHGEATAHSQKAEHAASHSDGDRRQTGDERPGRSWLTMR